MKKFLINLIPKKAPSTKSNFSHCDLKHSLDQLDQLGQLGFRNSSKGFTLIETIIYMALLAIFLLTLTDILVSVLDVQLESQATSAVDIDSRFINSRLSFDVLRTSAITTPANLGDVSNSLVMTIGGSQYTYSLFGGNMVL